MTIKFKSNTVYAPVGSPQQNYMTRLYDDLPIQFPLSAGPGIIKLRRAHFRDLEKISLSELHLDISRLVCHKARICSL
jgi:hypothetical protein